MSTQNGNSMAPHVIGEKFERYVGGCLFVSEHYELLETPPQFTTRKEYFPTSALRPDFKFRDKRTGRQFYVEAKECPTFLILGVGGRFLSKGGGAVEQRCTGGRLL